MDEWARLNASFPRFSDALCYAAHCVEVCAGEHLFVPALWLHDVAVTLAPAVSLQVFSGSLEGRVRDGLLATPLPFDDGWSPTQRSRAAHYFLRQLLGELGLTEQLQRAFLARMLSEQGIGTGGSTGGACEGEGEAGRCDARPQSACASGTGEDEGERGLTARFAPTVARLARLIRAVPEAAGDRRGQETVPLNGSRGLLLWVYVEILVNALVNSDPSRPDVLRTATFLADCFVV